MFLKTILIAFFAVGAMGYTVNKKDIIKAKYRPMCQETGNIDKLDQLVDAVDGSMKCFESNVNMENLPNEIRDAVVNGGGLKSVFKRYCDKSPEMKACAHTLSDGLALCMTIKMRELFISNNATDDVIDFACYNDGERISTFIVNDGPGCFQEKSEALSACAKNIQQDVSSPQAILNMSPAEQCSAFENLSSCMLKELKTCSSSAAANLMESLFQLVRKSSSCK